MYDLAVKDIEVLQGLVERLEAFDGDWYEDMLVPEIQHFFYDSPGLLLFPLSWEDVGDLSYTDVSTLSRESILKGLSVEGASHRFGDTTWEDFFMNRDGIRLLRRLLETYQEDSGDDA